MKSKLTRGARVDDELVVHLRVSLLQRGPADGNLVGVTDLEFPDVDAERRLGYRRPHLLHAHRVLAHLSRRETDA